MQPFFIVRVVSDGLCCLSGGTPWSAAVPSGAGQTFAAFGFPSDEALRRRRRKLGRCSPSDMRRLVSAAAPHPTALSTARHGKAALPLVLADL